MKRPSEYMTMTDGVTQQDYKNALNKYIDYLEAKIQALSQHDVSQQREQLISFFNWYKDDPKELSNNETIIDAYLEEINCG